MTAVATAPAPTPAPGESALRDPLNIRGVIGNALLAVAALLLIVTVPAGDSQIRLSTNADAVQIPVFAVPAPLTVTLMGLVIIGLAAWTIVRLVQRRPSQTWVTVLAGVLLLLAFLVHVGAGKSQVVALTGVLASTLFLATPLVFGALSGVVCERVGIVNIAIEGQLLAGAFLAAVVGSITASAYVGLIAAPIAGAMVGLILAIFSIRYMVDQIIVGVVLNVLVIGLTGFFYSTVLTEVDGFNDRTQLPTIPIPLLSEIPVLGPVLFRQNLLVYLLYVLVIGLQIMVFKSKWGLRLRAVGEHPKAADTVGINVNRTRFRNTLVGGAIAGLGGAYFTVASGLAFGKEMTAGRGFIALAAMILGRWSPKGALAAAILFGFAENLSQLLPTMGVSINSNLLLTIPYVVTIFAVAGFAGKVRAPAAENTPYVK